jgi:hypothetical protein
MALPQQRRIGLLDLMIFVAAIGLGLASLRFFVSEIKTPLKIGWLYRINLLRSCAAPPLAAVTLASLGLALIPPRPPLRRLARRPGFVTCATAAVCLAVVCPIEAFGYLHLYHGMLSTMIPNNWWIAQVAILVGSVTPPVGYMVAGSWLNMVFRRRWRARDLSNWIGLTIGACWIGLTVSGWMVYLD